MLGNIGNKVLNIQFHSTIIGFCFWHALIIQVPHNAIMYSRHTDDPGSFQMPIRSREECEIRSYEIDSIHEIINLRDYNARYSPHAMRFLSPLQFICYAIN